MPTILLIDDRAIFREGLRNADIAQRLSTTERTVKAHISAIFAGLEVSSRIQAVIVARRAGLLGRRPR
ncbi:MAG: response regulator transcription factor [Burkholderiales bacterium]|nr:response regulator transcription factor [Burkholderiales bacterium]